MSGKSRSLSFAALTLLALAYITFLSAQSPASKLMPKVIDLGTGDQEYIRLLGGPPESVTMRAGAVALSPGKTVGKHSTENYEELLVILEGQGTVIYADGKLLKVKAGTVQYCPPDTEHDVKNTGTGMLRYVYVVAKTR